MTGTINFQHRKQVPNPTTQSQGAVVTGSWTSIWTSIQEEKKEEENTLRNNRRSLL